MLSILQEKAEGLGFIALGFSRPGRPLYMDQYHRWISDHKNAEMLWLERNLDVREDPSTLLKGCQTIISLAYPYPAQKPATRDGFSVARYSHPAEEDYHPRIKRLCAELCQRVEESYEGCTTKICVDSSPILERSFAYTAGIGFIGKNNMLVIPGHGSFFFLAEILTTARLEFEPGHTMDNQCGSCRLCVDCCPTGALVMPFYLDASRCLSYLSIEYKDRVGDEAGRKMGDCFFGCDRCQEVCPFNEGELSKRIVLPPTDDFLNMSAREFKRRFGKTSLSRAGLEKIKANIQAIRS
ncbi:MAG: tRNA epoxyqueuosine(34) reductase QueG [Pseudomonadota bacterium]